MSGASIGEYTDYHAGLDVSHGYLLPTVLGALGTPRPGERLFDLGCGNGAVAEQLQLRGFDVTGVDPSERAIALAREHRPTVRLHRASAYDDLAGRFGQFDKLVSLEVVEHVYAPRVYAKTAFDLVKPGGVAVFTTPYHGYLKNLAIALAAGFDAHVTALWDHGHIKFWSVRTLGILLMEAGFVDLQWRRAGRVPAFAKSMIAIARKP
jgi:2-polyprenyl-6-hydroxyphenyl methylase/3-demethylubiquinone-9 3-methyltransferase